MLLRGLAMLYRPFQFRPSVRASSTDPVLFHRAQFATARPAEAGTPNVSGTIVPKREVAWHGMIVQK